MTYDEAVALIAITGAYVLQADKGERIALDVYLLKAGSEFEKCLYMMPGYVTPENARWRIVQWVEDGMPEKS